MLVRALILASSLVLATVAAGTASAQTSTAPARAPTPTGAPGTAKPSTAAAAAETLVNTFMADLAGGQLEAARQLMTPDAVVMANGQVLGDRDTYINGSAKGDVAALNGTQRELLHRAIQVGNDIGWVVSEKRVRRNAGNASGPREIVVTETMLLARTASGWKISHIHWSSRQVG